MPDRRASHRKIFNHTSVLLQPHIISLQDRERNSATASSMFAHMPLQRHWALDPLARPSSVHMASLRPSPTCERIHTTPSGAYVTISAVKKMSKTPPPPVCVRKRATPPLPDPTMLRDSEPILSGAMKYELALDEFVGAARSCSTLVTTATPASVPTPILRQATHKATQPQALDADRTAGSPPHYLQSQRSRMVNYFDPWHGHGASYADAKAVLHAGRQQLSVKQTRRQLPLSVRQPAADEMNARWLGARTASVLEDPRMDPRPSNDKLLPPWLPPELGITDEDEAEAVAQLDARGRRVLAQTRPQSAPTLLDGVPATSHVRMPIGNARWSQTLVSCTDGLRPP